MQIMRRECNYSLRITVNYLPNKEGNDAMPIAVCTKKDDTVFLLLLLLFLFDFNFVSCLAVCAYCIVILDFY